MCPIVLPSMEMRKFSRESSLRETENYFLDGKRKPGPHQTNRE